MQRHDSGFAVERLENDIAAILRHRRAHLGVDHLLDLLHDLAVIVADAAIVCGVVVLVIDSQWPRKVGQGAEVASSPLRR